MIKTLIIALPLTLVTASHFAPFSPPAPLSAISHASSTESVRTVLAASHDDLAAWAVSVRACGDAECLARLAAAPIVGEDEVRTAVKTAKVSIVRQAQGLVQGQQAGQGKKGGQGQNWGGGSGGGGWKGFGGGGGGGGGGGANWSGGQGGNGGIGCVTPATEKPATVAPNTAGARSGGSVSETGQYFCQCGRTCRYWNIYGGMAYC